MPPLPTHEQLLNLTHALLANAAALVDDASLLHEHGRHPRAYALAALSGEELGKVYLCLEALLPSEEFDGSRFWSNWRLHGNKLESARAYAAAFVDDLDTLDIDRLGSDAKLIGTQKLAAMYVDFNGQEPLTPDRIGAADAAALIATTRRSIDHAEVALGGLTSDVLPAMQALTPALTTVFDGITSDKAPLQVLAELRRLLVEAPEMTADQLIELLTSNLPPTG